MGLLDIFKRNKNKSKIAALPEPKNTEEKKELEEGRVNVYARRNGKEIEYSMQMKTSEGNINIGKFNNRGNPDNESNSRTFKDIKRDVEGILNTVRTAKGGQELAIAKKSARARLGSIPMIYFGFELNEEIMQYVDEYEPKNIQYGTLDKLPKVIDVSKMTPEQIIEYGEKLSGRLNTLDSIKTPEDAYDDRAALISYMKEKEEINLDEQSIIKVAKNMEQIDNEDGVLYAAYLKLEEKRILQRINSVVFEYNYNEGSVDISEARKVNRNIQYISDEIRHTKGGFSTEMFQFIIGSLKEENEETYNQKYKQNDERLYSMISEKRSEIQQGNRRDKNQILNSLNETLEFLGTRMECSGQLYLKNSRSGEKNSFREYVANTSFKDEDDKETKEFLYLVSQIEKENIKTTYRPILDIHREKNKDVNKRESFKDSLYYSTDPREVVARQQSNNEINKNRDTGYEK